MLNFVYRTAYFQHFCMQFLFSFYKSLPAIWQLSSSVYCGVCPQDQRKIKFKKRRKEILLLLFLSRIFSLPRSLSPFDPEEWLLWKRPNERFWTRDRRHLRETWSVGHISNALLVNILDSLWIKYTIQLL